MWGGFSNPPPGRLLWGYRRPRLYGRERSEDCTVDRRGRLSPHPRDSRLLGGGGLLSPPPRPPRGGDRPPPPVRSRAQRGLHRRQARAPVPPPAGGSEDPPHIGTGQRNASK